MNTESKSWWVEIDGKPRGPLSEAGVKQWLAKGELRLDSYVCRVGTAEWKRLFEYPEFLTQTEDYYALLGVKRDVSPAELAGAYRRAALKNHPDRGGSTAKMALINEAYAILSDPAQRANYDRLLAKHVDGERVAEWMNATEEVREKARDYPRQWEQFEKCMEGAIADVKAAKYGSSQIWGGFYSPTVEESKSGQSFIIIGTAVGILLALLSGMYPALFRVWFLKSPGDGLFDQLFSGIRHPIHMAITAGAPALLGAWIGRFIHQSLRDSLSQDVPSGASTDSNDQKLQEGTIIEYVTFPCEACAKKLRVPKLNKELVVTCPKCGNKSTRRASV